MAKPKIIISGPHPPTSSDHHPNGPFSAHLDQTEFTTNGADPETTLVALIDYVHQLGWPGSIEEYELVDSQLGQPDTASVTAVPSPIIVAENPNRPGHWVATPSGAPHLSGFGRTADAAFRHCREYLSNQGFSHLFHDYPTLA